MGKALIRPEQLFISGEGRDHPFLDVEIEQLVFVGSSFELFGHTAEGRKVSAEIPAGRRSFLGEVEQTRKARLSYDPAAVHLIGCDADGI